MPEIRTSQISVTIKIALLSLVALVLVAVIATPYMKERARGDFIDNALYDVRREAKDIADGVIKIGPRKVPGDSSRAGFSWFDPPILYFSNGDYALMKTHCTHVGWMAGDVSVLIDKSGNAFVSDDHFCIQGVALSQERQPENLDEFLKSENHNYPSHPRWVKLEEK